MRQWRFADLSLPIRFLRDDDRTNYGLAVESQKPPGVAWDEGRLRNVIR